MGIINKVNSYKQNHNIDTNIPLLSVKVNGTNTDSVGEITVTQQYKNTYASTIEALYVFNLTDDSVVTNLTFTIGSKTFIGQVQEKTHAKQTYNDAKAEKKTTCLLEKLENSSYKMSLGTLSPNELVEITFTYLTVLPYTQNGIRFVLPTNIAPKYEGSSNKTVNDLLSTGLTNTVTHSSGANYPFELTINWSSANTITSVKSLTNEIEVTGTSKGNEVNVSCTTVPKYGDFNLFVKTEVNPATYYYQENDNVYMMTTQQIPSVEVSNENKEFIFVVDRSGSMDQTWTTWSGSVESQSPKNKIFYAKEALKIFIESLPANSKFNVVSFGSTYSALYRKSVLLTDAIRDNVLKEVETFSGDMGGTEMFNCLSDVLQNDIKYSKNDVPNQINLTKREWIAPISSVFSATNDTANTTSTTNNTNINTVTNSGPVEKIIVLLTDGQIDNNDALTELVRKFNHVCRIFCVGIGADADRKLVNSVSKATNGFSEMLIDTMDVNSVVIQMLDSSLKTYYKNVRLLNKIATEKDGFVQFEDQIVNKDGAIYPEQVATFFNKMPLSTFNQLNEMRLLADEGQSGTLTSWNLNDVKIQKNNFSFLKQLWANDQICNGNLTNQQIIKLSLDYHLMNNLTSFVAVNHKDVKSEKTTMTVAVDNYNESIAKPMASSASYFSYGGSRGSSSKKGMASRSRGVMLSANSSGPVTKSINAANANYSTTAFGCTTTTNFNAFASTSFDQCDGEMDMFDASVDNESDEEEEEEQENGKETENCSFGSAIKNKPVVKKNSTYNIQNNVFKVEFNMTELLKCKSADGSFKYSEQMIPCLGLTKEIFDQMLTEFSLTNETLFNLVLYVKLLSTNQAQYKMILRNLKTVLDFHHGGLSSSAKMTDLITAKLFELEHKTINPSNNASNSA
jgi:hypothetical protein